MYNALYNIRLTKLKLSFAIINGLVFITVISEFPLKEMEAIDFVLKIISKVHRSLNVNSDHRCLYIFIYTTMCQYPLQRSQFRFE